MDFETRAIHAGQEPDPATGAIITPIYQTSTYVQEAVGKHKGYDYARVANPTRSALEACLASLEGAEFGLAYSSGLGATTTVMHLVDPGERILTVNEVYGGVYRTLALRMQKHSKNGRAVAEFLDAHPAVERVLYPGLPSHPGHELAARQMRDFGGMVSFLAESEEEAVALCARTRLFQLAESLGGVESLIEHPARMTHASTADAPFAPPASLVRLSVGIESADDLLADLEHAF